MIWSVLGGILGGILAAVIVWAGWRGLMAYVVGLAVGRFGKVGDPEGEA